MAKVKIPSDWNAFSNQMFTELASQLEDDNTDPYEEGVDITITIDGREVDFFKFAEVVEKSFSGNVKRGVERVLRSEFNELRQKLVDQVNDVERATDALFKNEYPEFFKKERKDDGVGGEGTEDSGAAVAAGGD